MVSAISAWLHFNYKQNNNACNMAKAVGEYQVKKCNAGYFKVLFFKSVYGLTKPDESRT